MMENNKRISREELVVKCMRNQTIPYMKSAKLSKSWNVYRNLRFNTVLGDFLFYESVCIQIQINSLKSTLKMRIPSIFLIGDNKL